MIEIIYASAAERRFDDQQLALLLKQARENNQSLGITGILLYDQGSFLQVLEGDEAQVAPLFDAIAQDARHGRVKLLRRKSIDKRSFDGWTMGFVSLDAGLRQQLASRHALMSNGSLRVDDEAGMIELLDQFRQGRWRQYISG